MNLACETFVAMLHSHHRATQQKQQIETEEKEQTETWMTLSGGYRSLFAPTTLTLQSVWSN
jgi:hypothetical protein